MMKNLHKALADLHHALRNDALGIEAHLKKMSKAVNSFEEEYMDKLFLYKRYRPYMREADSLQMHSYGTVGSLIRCFSVPGWLKHGEINHTSLIKREAYEGVEDRRWLLEALAHGPEYNLVSERLLDYKGYVYWLPVREVFDPWREHVLAWMVLQVNKGYDYDSVAKQIFGRVSANARSLYCSEYYFMGWTHALKIWILENHPTRNQLDDANEMYGCRLCDSYKIPSKCTDPGEIEVTNPFGFDHVPNPNELPLMGIFKTNVTFDGPSPLPSIHLPFGSHGIAVYNSDWATK